MSDTIVIGPTPPGTGYRTLYNLIQGFSPQRDVELFELNKMWLKAVSYTHLDVYKRQDYPSKEDFFFNEEEY